MQVDLYLSSWWLGWSSSTWAVDLYFLSIKPWFLLFSSYNQGGWFWSIHEAFRRSTAQGREVTGKVDFAWGSLWLRWFHQPVSGHIYKYIILQLHICSCKIVWWRIRDTVLYQLCSFFKIVQNYLHFVPRGDVWSFGILMYEVLTIGENPYHEFRIKNAPFKERMKNEYEWGIENQSEIWTHFQHIPWHWS